MENNARNRRPFFLFLLLEKEKRNDKFYSTNMIGGARNFWRQIRILGCKAMPIFELGKNFCFLFSRRKIFSAGNSNQAELGKWRGKFVSPWKLCARYFYQETELTSWVTRRGEVYRREITNYNYLWKSVRWWIIQAKDGVATRKHEENRPFTINNETRGGNKRRSVK